MYGHHSASTVRLLEEVAAARDPDDLKSQLAHDFDEVHAGDGEVLPNVLLDAKRLRNSSNRISPVHTMNSLFTCSWTSVTVRPLP